MQHRTARRRFRSAARRLRCLNSGPLPQEQAFKFEAIATGPGEVLARFTMPKNYYLYRDKTHFTTDTPGVTLGAPKWPAGKEHTDANFGTTTVYYDQIEVPVPLSRAKTDAQDVAITTTFQGCLENNVCYPEMTRTVTVPLPAGKTDAVAAAPSRRIDRQPIQARVERLDLAGVRRFLPRRTRPRVHAVRVPDDPDPVRHHRRRGRKYFDAARVRAVDRLRARQRGHLHDRRRRRGPRRRESAGRVPEAVDAVELRRPVRAARAVDVRLLRIAVAESWQSKIADISNQQKGGSLSAWRSWACCRR